LLSLNKRYLIFFFLSARVLYLPAQNGFNKYFPAGVNSRPNDIIKNKDSTYTMTSQFLSPVTGDPGVAFTKFDKLGNLLFQKKYLENTVAGYYTPVRSKMSVVVNEGSFITIGASISTYSTWGIMATRINVQTLDTIWVRYFSVPNFDLPVNNIVKITENRYWLITNKFDNSNTAYLTRPAIYEIDTLGNISFNKELSVLLNYSESRVAYDTIQERLYVTGITGVVPQQCFVACLDSAGGMIWNKQIGSHPYAFPNYFEQIEIKNNYLVLGGFKMTNYDPNGFNGTRMSILKLNSINGALIWQKAYCAESIQSEIYGLEVESNEDISASGIVEVVGTATVDVYGVLLKTNSNGDSLWSRSYSNHSGSVSEGFLDIHHSFDGGYIMCGSTFYAPSNHSWVVKTDSLGIGPGVVVPPTVTTTVSFKASGISLCELKIYPNPTPDKLSIEISGNDDPDLRFSIQNTFGKLVSEEKNLSAAQEIDLSKFAPGIYLLNIRGKEEQKTIKMIKE
jgi:hypothetical protein